MRQLVEWGLRTSGGVILAIGCASCGDGKAANPGVDASGGVDTAASGHDIRLELSAVDGTLQNGQLVALQDGDAAWTSVTGTAGVYLAHIDNDRFGVVVGCVYDDLTSFTQMIFQTASDGTTLHLFSCDDTPGPFKITGTLSGFVPGDSITVQARSTLIFVNDEAGTYSVDALAGKTDLFAGLTSSTDHTRDKVIRKPGLDVTADLTIPLDFAADGVAFDTPALTIADSSARTRTSIYASGRTYRLQPGSFASSTKYQALPAALQQPGDLTIVQAFVADGRSSTVVTTGGPVSMTLPSAFTAPTPVLVTDGYVRPHVMFPVGGGTLPLVSYGIDYVTINNDTGRIVDWDAEFSEAWTAGATTVDFTVPDFSALAGFDAKLELEHHQAIVGSVSRVETTSNDTAAGVKRASAGTDFTLGSYCGDGIIDPEETCDDAGESATCDADCTAVSCGDGVINFTAGEECDPPDGTTCDDSCHMIVPPPVARRHSMIWPAASRKIKNALNRFVPFE